MKQKKRKNRTVHVDFQDESTYFRLIEDGFAFLEFVLAYVASIGFQFFHKCSCSGNSRFQRHSHYARARLGGLCIWRIQCCECKATFSILPHFVLRYRSMSPDVAKRALIASNGGLSLENTSMILNISVMSIYCFICSIGVWHVATTLLRAGLSLPHYWLADEKHSKCRADKGYLPTIVEGRVIWHLGYSEGATAEKFKASYAQFQQIALKEDPTYHPEGILTDGYESTRLSLKELFPLVFIGYCLLHAAKKLPSKIKGVSFEIRKSLSRKFSIDLFTPAKLSGMEVFSVAQRLRHFTKRVQKEAGEANALSIKEWIAQKKQGWFETLRHPNIPNTSTLLDQAHNQIDRKLFMMKHFHHKEGNKEPFINALAILYNFIPYQRRAKNAHLNGVQVQGGTMPHQDWFFSLMILTSAGGMIRSG
jgi:hypothetical protein